MERPQLTRDLVEFVLSTSTFPASVETAGTRSLLNILGCMFGGVNHPANDIASGLAMELSGPPTTTLIGRSARTDGLTAAYLNCLAASAHAFDDTHLETVIHPAGPVASTAFAAIEHLHIQRRPPTGRELLEALILGIEVECRLGQALWKPPAEGQWGWYATGVAGGIGAASAASRLLGLSAEQTRWALGIAANQASGFRQTHGTMCTGFVPAHAARCGYQAALLAERGFTASDAALEGTNGFLDVFSLAAHPESAVEGLGSRWEILNNAFKPYPCGIVIHPVLDACLEIAQELHNNATAPAQDIAAVELDVNPMCLMLCARPEPASSQLAQVSVQHWAAAALVRGRAGLAEGADECVGDLAVKAVRQRVRAEPSETVPLEGARVRVHLKDGTQIGRTVENAIGSLERPMTDAELDGKFREQAGACIEDEQQRERLMKLCWSVESLPEATTLIELARA